MPNSTAMPMTVKTPHTIASALPQSPIFISMPNSHAMTETTIATPSATSNPFMIRPDS